MSIRILNILNFQIQNYAYSIVPFTLLLVFNSLLVYNIHLEKKRSIPVSKNRKKYIKAMTIINLISTLIFIVCTAPIAIVGAYFLNLFKSSENGLAWLSFLNFLRFLRHSINFVFLFISNRKFKKEAKFVLMLKNNKVQNVRDGQQSIFPISYTATNMVP
jgi:hypothetical protein